MKKYFLSITQPDGKNVIYHEVFNSLKELETIVFTLIMKRYPPLTKYEVYCVDITESVYQAYSRDI